MGLFYVIFWSFLGFSQSDIPIEFGSEITTCLSKQEVWQELERSMRNSNDSWLWPNELSQVEGEGVFNGARIYVTYDAGLFAPTYTYYLEDVEDGRSLTYTALEINHPFKGGATIELSEVAQNQTLLQWTGLYLTRPFDFIQRQFFNRFSKNFFEQLAVQIKTQEFRKGCSD
jgi:hypothetical protein